MDYSFVLHLSNAHTRNIQFARGTHNTGCVELKSYERVDRILIWDFALVVCAICCWLFSLQCHRVLASSTLFFSPLSTSPAKRAMVERQQQRAAKQIAVIIFNMEFKLHKLPRTTFSLHKTLLPFACASASVPYLVYVCFMCVTNFSIFTFYGSSLRCQREGNFSRSNTRESVSYDDVLCLRFQPFFLTRWLSVLSFFSERKKLLSE